ncbi:Structural maintenance of chromosomes protein 1A [Nymphon striatum]|nr:Structural maintenance of chromosomes protein 1A [Nymphon striatum]
MLLKIFCSHSGKSNLMDAISFVLGERTSSLRVKRLTDLIHGAPVGAPVSNKAVVTAVFENDDGTEINFRRIVTGSASEYRIDQAVVPQQEYFDKLVKIGINIKAKNFLVFQGAVESIAMKNPKEITQLFEEISRSNELKTDYDAAKAEMLKAEEDTQFSYQKRRGIAAERKEAKMEKEEADRYRQLQDDMSKKQIEYHLFLLYHLDQEIENLTKELSLKNKNMEKVSAKKKSVEETLKSKKKEHNKLTHDGAKIDQDIRKAEMELNKKRPAYIKAKEKTAHLQKKLEMTQKTLKSAKKAHDSHQTEIKELEVELQGIHQKQEEWESVLAEESQSQGRDMTLEESQVREYNRLKEEAGKLSSRYLQELDSINRDQKSDQDRRDNEGRKQAETNAEIKQKRAELEEAHKRLDKLNDYTRESQKSLEEQRRLETEIGEEVQRSKERVTEINQDLESIMHELGDAKVDKHEDSRRRKKAEIVENFKRLFPGVYDRLLNMCQPVDKRYNIGITKVLGKNMEAIVVDSEKTARSCIQYLKDQMLDAETFLPLDYIDAKPLKERLRNIDQPTNVRLLYDVLRYDPPAIKRAVLFATNNALLCETAPNANTVAYDLGDGRRYDAVALDGTYYQKNGFISGGSVDLAKRARRWDEKSVHNLKHRKEAMTEELKECMKKTRKESELTTIQSQIRGLEMRLKYSVNDKDNTEKRVIVGLENDIEKLEKKLKVCNISANQWSLIVRYELALFMYFNQPEMDEISLKMEQREKKIQEVKNNMNNVEDEVFAEFCVSIGVKNIRQYEEKELQAQQERGKKRLEYENQKYRIQTQLEYEKSRDTYANVEKYRTQVEEEEQELDRMRKAEKTQMELVSEEMKNLEDNRNLKITKKANIDDVEEEINDIRKKITSVQKEQSGIQKQQAAIESKIDQKRSDKHGLFRVVRLENIRIPLSSGTWNDLDPENSQQDDSEASDRTTEQGDASSLSTQARYQRADQLVIDFSMLSDDLKDLDQPEDIKHEDNKLQKEMQDMMTNIQRIQAPNMKAVEKLDGVKERLKETDTEFDNARKRAMKAKQAFERVRIDRYNRFMHCFEHISNVIDDIYKLLARNQSAQAFLGPENPEEPYLEGVNYNCVAPGKRFQPMGNLSGGEKTVAALALLFAIHNYQQAPFFVLDEIDAALDNTNISKVASFIREQTETKFQCVVISLKEEFYGHADALIGIIPDPGNCTISRVLTLDMTKYPQ